MPSCVKASMPSIVSEGVTIPQGKLHAGENVISLTLTNPKGLRQHVMYDYLSLELP